MIQIDKLHFSISSVNLKRKYRGVNNFSRKNTQNPILINTRIYPPRALLMILQNISIGSARQIHYKNKVIKYTLLGIVISYFSWAEEKKKTKIKITPKRKDWLIELSKVTKERHSGQMDGWIVCTYIIYIIYII